MLAPLGGSISHLFIYILSLLFVRHYGIQTHLGLEFWLNSVAHGPNLSLPMTPARAHERHGSKLRIA